MVPYPIASKTKLGGCNQRQLLTTVLTIFRHIPPQFSPRLATHGGGRCWRWWSVADWARDWSPSRCTRHPGQRGSTDRESADCGRHRRQISATSRPEGRSRSTTSRSGKGTLGGVRVILGHNVTPSDRRVHHTLTFQKFIRFSQWGCLRLWTRLWNFFSSSDVYRVFRLQSPSVRAFRVAFSNF